MSGSKRHDSPAPPLPDLSHQIFAVAEMKWSVTDTRFSSGSHDKFLSPIPLVIDFVVVRPLPDRFQLHGLRMCCPVWLGGPIDLRVEIAPHITRFACRSEVLAKGPASSFLTTRHVNASVKSFQRTKEMCDDYTRTRPRRTIYV